LLSETSAALTVVMEGRAASNSNPETQAFFELRLNYLEWMAMRGYLLHLQHGRLTLSFSFALLLSKGCHRGRDENIIY
jgi:hypothetical protein